MLDRWQQEFRGLGAFNHYFGVLSPSGGIGYTLPDVWDGYFHITLAKFRTPLDFVRLDEVLNQFDPPMEGVPHIPDVVFRASRIRSVSGANRARGRSGIDFIVLDIDQHPDVESFYHATQPLLSHIQRETLAADWTPTPLDGLHVTLRKYTNFNFPPNGIPINQYPVEFRCSRLEIRRTREGAVQRFEQLRGQPNPGAQWWDGVTEIDRRCSDCNTPVTSRYWEGFCVACGQHEVMRPLWLTTGNEPAQQGNE